MRRPKALMAWSTGKDSAYAYHLARDAGDIEIVGLLTTMTDAFGRVSMHGVRESLLDRQAAELGLPCHKVRIPAPCPNEVYEQHMSDALQAAKNEGISHVLFGDLFLEDLRAYRETKLREAGFTAVFPLWRKDTRALADEMLRAGLSAVVTCIDPQKLSPSSAGRTFDAAWLEGLPEGVDPCGENGEFHTFVTQGPMFRQTIAVTPGVVVERDGFVFADLLPAGSADAPKEIVPTVVSKGGPRNLA